MRDIDIPPPPLYLFPYIRTYPSIPKSFLATLLQKSSARPSREIANALLVV